MSGPDADMWYKAAAIEMQAHLDNGTWELVTLPAGRKAIGSKWVFKIKRKADGSIKRYKACLVAQGFSQRPGVNFTETFAPTTKWAALHSIFTLAAFEDLELESIARHRQKIFLITRSPAITSRSAPPCAPTLPEACLLSMPHPRVAPRVTSSLRTSCLL
jgi:hypothetical protein